MFGRRQRGRAERGAAILKAVLWSAVFLAASFVCGTLLYAGIALLVGGSRADAWLVQGGAGVALAQGLAYVISAGAFTYLIGVRGLGLSVAALRYPPPPVAGRGFAGGLAVGGMAAAAALLVAVGAGDARWVGEAATPGSYPLAALQTVLVLAPAALGEELLFRGVPLVLLAATFGRAWAIIFVAVVFALLHLGNPNVTALGLANIAIAGVFLGIIFYTQGGLWAAFGAHLGWNAALAVLDAPVSGLPFRVPAIDYEPGGPAWLTGGRFGPEGGLAATFALTAAAAAVVRRLRKDKEQT